MKRPIVISFEGIIAAGKSSTINFLEKQLSNKGYNVVVSTEPVEQWEEIGIFEKFYKNKSKYAYLFQTYVFSTRIKNLREGYLSSKDKVDVFIIERSPRSDKIFMESLYLAGTIKELEWKVYLEWEKEWKSHIPFDIDYTFYITVDIEESMKRIKLRDRKGEETIDSKYQENLTVLHDKYMVGENIFKIASDENIFLRVLEQIESLLSLQ